MAQGASAERPARNEGNSSMTSTVDDTATQVFELICTDCAFKATVEGSLFEALSVADSHQEEYGVAAAGHFVNFERKDATD